MSLHANPRLHKQSWWRVHWFSFSFSVDFNFFIQYRIWISSKDSLTWRDCTL